MLVVLRSDRTWLHGRRSRLPIDPVTTPSPPPNASDPSLLHSPVFLFCGLSCPFVTSSPVVGGESEQKRWYASVSTPLAVGSSQSWQAPKIQCNTQKLATIQKWFQKSRTAHTLKDLEKSLPGIGSINGMQVKGGLHFIQGAVGSYSNADLGSC